jgi:hypothetical protein
MEWLFSQMNSENDTIRYYCEHACVFIESLINADITLYYDIFIRYLPEVEMFRCGM